MRTITSTLSSLRPFFLRGIMVMLTVIPVTLFPQGEFNNWYFGDNAGITFNSGSPTVLLNSNLWSSSQPISISDSLGNFLFSSNGVIVLNRNQQQMPNGWGLQNGGTGYAQSVLAVQKIGDDSSYFLFTTGPFDYINGSHGLCYSIVNMRLDGGLGDIEIGKKNLPITYAGKAYVPVSGTRDNNNKDAWIGVRLSDPDSNFYLTYKITSSGISALPVVSNSNAPPPVWIVSQNLPIQMKFSPDGTKMICLYSNDTAEFCHFDSKTGQITSLFLFRPGVHSFYPSETNTAEFSIDSRYLYISGFCFADHNAIFQYSTNILDSLHVVQSEVLIGIIASPTGLQMGPDLKIYIDLMMKDSLCVINYPSLQGTSCDLEMNVLSLEGRWGETMLPQFIQRYYAYINHNGSCQYNPVFFNGTIWPPPDSISWDFGDPASGSSNHSNDYPAYHTYSTPGDYPVIMIVRHIDKRFDTAYATIHIDSTYLPQLGPDQTICAGDSITFDAGACTGCSYFWTDYLADTIVSTIQTFRTGSPGIYTVKVINTNGCKGYDTVQLFVIAPPVVTTSPLSKSICSGDSTRIPLSANVAGTTFSWSVFCLSPLVSGFSPGTGDTINQKLTSTSPTYETVTYWITPTAGNCTGDSVAYVVTVSPGDSVGITIAASANPVCEGTLVTFTATPVNEGISPVYQWKVNGINVGTNSSIYTYLPVTSDQVTCILTSSETVCVTNNPATSNTITMTVNPNNPVSVMISPSLNPVCSGVSVTFTAIPQYGGSSPTYQWQVNGINAGTNNPVFTYTPVNNDIVTCILTSSETVCVSNNPATSNLITMTVNPNLPVSVSIIASANPVCSGTSVTFTATPTNGGTTPSYQWKVNGINTGTNNLVFTYLPVNNDVVTCILTSSETICVINNPATSNPITMTVNPNLPVSVSIAASANPVCSGTSVIYTATPVNGGTTPSYQWRVNGINVGTNNPVYTYNPVSGDIISCILTSSETLCVTNNPATSNSITMIVNPTLPVSVLIAASNNPVCEGNPVTFTAIPTNGGASPVYQWQVNGVNAGTNNPVYIFNPVNGDIITCILTSSIACPTGNPAMSNSIIMGVAALPVITFTLCNDPVTTTNAAPFKLKGGIPLGGTYSGPGVNSATGIFYPALSGTGIKTITYSYTNAALCSANATMTITVIAPAAFVCGNNLTDIRDNKVYPTVQLGSQCWMASNLNYGSQIAGSIDQRDNCIVEKYCYNDSPALCALHAALYQWDELMQFDATQGIQGLCPPAWHVPTEADWNTLFAIYINNAFAGSPLKYSGYSGFNALLSGVRLFNKSWNYDGFATFFWSSTSWGPTKAWAHAMNDMDPSVALYPSYRTNAFSVRCVKD